MHPTNYKRWLGRRCAVSCLSVLAGPVTARRSDERESRESTKRSDESRKDEDEVGRRENDFAGISITPGELVAGEGPGTRCGLFSNLIVVGPRFPLLLPVTVSKRAPLLAPSRPGPSWLGSARLVSVPLSPSSWKPGRWYAVVSTRVGTRVRTYTHAFVDAQDRP